MSLPKHDKLILRLAQDEETSKTLILSLSKDEGFVAPFESMCRATAFRDVRDGRCRRDRNRRSQMNRDRDGVRHRPYRFPMHRIRPWPPAAVCRRASPQQPRARRHHRNWHHDDDHRHRHPSHCQTARCCLPAACHRLLHPSHHDAGDRRHCRPKANCRPAGWQVESTGRRRCQNRGDDDRRHRRRRRNRHRCRR